MAKRPTKRSDNVIQLPQAAPPQFQDMPVEHAAGDDTTIIDAKTGHVTRINPDGSMSVGSALQPKKERGAKTFNDNLAEDLDESTLQKISNRILEGIEQDIRSRSEWEQTGEKGADLIGVKLEEASAEVGPEGTISKVRHTGLLRACLSSWSNSRAELLPVNGPVKVRDDADEEDDVDPPAGNAPNTGIAAGMPPQGIAGNQPAAPPPAPGAPPPPDPAVRRMKLANAFAADFNHYLTVVDKDYYPDFSRMLMSRALFGVQYRKVYRDPVLQRPVSRWVRGTDLIVSNDATTLATAGRYTERIQMRQGQVKRLQSIKHWRDIALVIPTTSPTPMDRKIADQQGIKPTSELPADQLHTIYECYTDLDEGILGEDEAGKEIGYAVPYRVTIDKDSQKILEIRRNWKRGDELRLQRRRYVKYGHVPSLGFYDWGFVHLIGNMERGATMVQRCLTDTGMLNSFPGGLIARAPGSRQKTTQIRPGLGEWVTWETGGKPISDIAMPWPYKEPSAVLAAMGSDMANQMNQVAGIVELPVGEGRIGNTPATTIMAYIETVTKVPGAVHKDDHISQQEEYEILQELFAEDPTALVKFARSPKRKWQTREEVMDQRLVPASDPNVPSQTHRLMQVNMLKDLSGMQQFAGIPNMRAIWDVCVRTIGFANTGEYTNPPAPPAPPPPDPRVQAANIKAESQAKSDAIKAQTAQMETAADADKQAKELQDKAQERESEDFRAATKAHAEVVSASHGTLQHAAGLAADHIQHTDQMQQASTELAVNHVQHLQKLHASTLNAAQPDAAAPNTDGQGIAAPPQPGS